MMKRVPFPAPDVVAQLDPSREPTATPGDDEAMVSAVRGPEDVYRTLGRETHAILWAVVRATRRAESSRRAAADCLEHHYTTSSSPPSQAECWQALTGRTAGGYVVDEDTLHRLRRRISGQALEDAVDSFERWERMVDVLIAALYGLSETEYTSVCGLNG